MKKIRELVHYFSKGEWILWSSSILLILLSFFIFDRSNYMAATASVIGATSLLFIAKGNPIGQILMVVFSILYGIISYTCTYYGEMITYLGMSAPMAIFALISWLRNPYQGKKSQVKINRLKPLELIVLFLISLGVTIALYFILEAFHTAHLIVSTISVFTSFLAAALTFRRSSYYALAYAANDIVLIILWILASISNLSYLSVIVCFAIFLLNDLYGFINWSKIYKSQENHIS